MSAFPTTPLETYLSSTVTGGAPITAMEILAGFTPKAEANTNYNPAPAFTYDFADLVALLSVNNKYQGILTPASDGSVQIGYNPMAFVPILADALLALNADYQAYKTAHP